jgi:hypothetical protein
MVFNTVLVSWCFLHIRFTARLDEERYFGSEVHGKENEENK